MRNKAVVALDDAALDAVTGGSPAFSPGSVPRILGTEHGEELLGSDRADIIAGGAGDDGMNGWGGGDFLIGGEGNDTILGGDGDDTILWSSGDGNDIIDGEGGHDTLVIQPGQPDTPVTVTLADGTVMPWSGPNGLEVSGLSGTLSFRDGTGAMVEIRFSGIELVVMR